MTSLLFTAISGLSMARRILIVEDDSDFTDLVRSRLEVLGCSIETEIRRRFYVRYMATCIKPATF